MTESDGVRLLVAGERAWVPTMADIESAARRAREAREAQRAAHVKARERRSRAAREAREAREGARLDETIARESRATDPELSDAAARHASCERQTARDAARRADPGRTRHVACAQARHDKRRDGARADAAKAVAFVAKHVAFARECLTAAERMPTTTRAERRARRNAIHNAQRELRRCVH